MTQKELIDKIKIVKQDSVFGEVRAALLKVTLVDQLGVLSDQELKQKLLDDVRLELGIKCKESKC